MNDSPFSSDELQQKNLVETSSSAPVLQLGDLEPGQRADCFALLSGKQRGLTRDGKPYYRVTFCDAARAVTAMIWNDTAWFAECEQNWKEGTFYKLRCRYVENQYGSQIEVERIRETREADEIDGFVPENFYETTRFGVAEMFAELRGLAEEAITEEPLQQLVMGVLDDYAEPIQTLPAAARNHHAFGGGYLEHVLSVTRTALYLAEKYRAYYVEMDPPLSQSLVVAGAILHDIGKVAELDFGPQGAGYTADGELVGHILLGRDIVREKAASLPELDRETALRLEHMIVSHQGQPAWGSPIPPHTPEALLVHYADDLDAKFHMMARALQEAPAEPETFTGRDNPLRRRIFRGLLPDEEAENG